MRTVIVHDDPVVAMLAGWLVDQVESCLKIDFKQGVTNEKTQTAQSAASYEGGAGLLVPVHVSTAQVPI